MANDDDLSAYESIQIRRVPNGWAVMLGMNGTSVNLGLECDVRRFRVFESIESLELFVVAWASADDHSADA